MPHRDLRFNHDYVEDAPPVVPIQGAVSGKAGGPVTDHSHTASGDGGTFDAANLRSDEDAEDGAVLSSDGAEGSEWRLLTLDSLADVNAADPDDGDVPTWDDSAGEWVASPPAGGAMALDDLTDVDAAAPDDEDVLTWDDVAGKWVAAPPAGGTVDAGDVTYTPTTAADWDSSADPGNADDAFDQLAERVKALEAAGLIGSGVAVQKGSSAALSSNNGNGTVLFATEFDSTPTVAISPRQLDIDPNHTPWVKITQVATTGFSYAYAFGASGYGGTAMYIDYIAVGPSAGGTVDAADVTYTPTTATDWDGSADPGDVDNALDQLAERVDDLEAGGGGGGALSESRIGLLVQPLTGATLSGQQAIWTRFVALADCTLTQVQAAVYAAGDDIRCRILEVDNVSGNATVQAVVHATAYQAVSAPEFASFSGLSVSLEKDKVYVSVIEVETGATLQMYQSQSQLGYGSLLPATTNLGGSCARDVGVGGTLTQYSNSLPTQWLSYS